MKKYQEDDKIISKQSITAIAVAQGVIAAVNQPKWSHLAPKDSTLLLNHFVAKAVSKYPYYKEWLILNATRSVSYSWQEYILNNIVTMGYSIHMAMRKFMIEQQVRKAITEDKATNVVICGAGYSDLAVRLHKEFPHVKFFELDYGQTRINKKAALKDFATLNDPSNPLSKYATLGKNISFIECNLGKDDVGEKLASKGFQPDDNSVFTAEGVLMYLPKDQAHQLFRQVHQLMSNDSKFIASFYNKNKHSNLSNEAREKAGENYNYLIPGEQVHSEVKQFGLEISSYADYNHFQRVAGSGIINPDNNQSERYVILKKSSNTASAEVKNWENTPLIEIILPEKDLAAQFSKGWGCQIV